MSRLRNHRPGAVPLVLAAALLVGCARQPVPGSEATPEQSAAGALTGTWELAPVEGRGPRMGFAVDSTAGDRFFGHVTLAFVGDIGLDPDGYAPFTGTVGPDTVAAFVVRRAATGDVEWDVAIQPRADTLVVRRLVLAGENLLAGGPVYRGNRPR